MLDHLCRAVSVDKRITRVIKCQENTGVLFQIFLLFALTETLKNRVLTVERAPALFPFSSISFADTQWQRTNTEWSHRVQVPGGGLHSVTGITEAQEETLW